MRRLPAALVAAALAAGCEGHPALRVEDAGLAPSQVRTAVRGGRPAERVLLRRLVAGAGRSAIRTIRIEPVPTGFRRRRATIWLAFDISALPAAGKGAGSLLVPRDD